MGALMLLALLTACEADKPAPTDPAADTPDAPEAGDTASGAWVPPEPVCVLANPAVLAEVPTFWHVYGPDFLHVSSLQYDLSSYEAEFGCPGSTHDAEGGSTRWEGPCAFDVFEWDGRWTTIERTEPDGTLYWADVGEDVRAWEDYWYGHAYTFDGIVEIEQPPDGSSFGVTRDFALSLHGEDFAQAEGDWIVRSFERYVPDTVYTIEAFIEAHSTGGLDGEYCLLHEDYWYAGCDMEPYGGWLVQGANRVVVSFDPHVACDGCGTATLDGVEMGEVCGYEYGAWVPG